MLKNIDSLKKNKNISVKLDRIRPVSCLLLVVFTLLFLVIFMVNMSSNTVVMAGSVSYTPASPLGNTSGNVNMVYKYIIYTIDTGSCWMFDWGDGTYSDWIEVGFSDTSVSQFHSWSPPGVYEVRVKHKTIYNVESSWSNPLIVEITSDLDMDGWIDAIEFSYGTSSTDPANYPLDTDGDGIPDDDSSDSKYVGDTDDDNDELDDLVELQLGSNPKNVLDVKKLGINGVSYYLVDTTGDSESDIFYNTVSGGNSTVGMADGDMYLIDFDGDGKWDYTYDPMYEAVTPYEESCEFSWSWAIIAIITGVIVVIYLLFKTGVLYLYEEYVIEE